MDVETTGLSPANNRIIDIGVIKVENGQIIDTYQTLINPLCEVPRFIQYFTGISPLDLEYAPSFRQIQDDLWTLLTDGTLVAHNAQFDYGFLTTEFARQKMSFSAPLLCTVKLSRKLFPEYRHHGLDQIIDRFQIKVAHRHRALDDAMAVWEFYKKLLNDFSDSKMNQVVSNLLGKSN